MCGGGGERKWVSIIKLAFMYEHIILFVTSTTQRSNTKDQVLIINIILELVYTSR